MEAEEITSTWNTYGDSLEKLWALTLHCIESVQKQKARSKLKKVLTLKIIAIVLGIAWILFLGFLVYHSLTFSKIFFAVSLGMIALFSAIAIVVYIKHSVLITQIVNSKTIIETQQRIASLQVSTVQAVRFLWLQMPFYTTFFYTPEWIKNDPVSFWFIAFPITLAFTFLSIWLYRNISMKNINKKWVKFFLGGDGWKSMTNATEFLDEIDEFKKDV